MGFIWTIIIGFIAGLIAKFVMPGRNEPSGFVLTTILGIVGAFLATFVGQALGWYTAGEGAGLIGAIVGAIAVLFIWGAISRRRGAAASDRLSIFQGVLPARCHWQAPPATRRTIQSRAPQAFVCDPSKSGSRVARQRPSTKAMRGNPTEVILINKTLLDMREVHDSSSRSSVVPWASSIICNAQRPERSKPNETERTRT